MDFLVSLEKPQPKKPDQEHSIPQSRDGKQLHLPWQCRSTGPGCPWCSMLMPNSCVGLCDELTMATRGRWRACALKTATGAESVSRHCEKGRGVNDNCVETTGITWNYSRQKECMAILGIRNNTVEEGKWSESRSVVSSSLQPHGLYSLWNSPGQNTGVGSLSVLQWIFPSQWSNWDLMHYRWILYQLSHKGSPRILEWIAFPFTSGSSQPRNWTRVSCIAGEFFTKWAIREALLSGKRGPRPKKLTERSWLYSW